MAELTYREAVSAGIAQEMRLDKNVVFLGEDIAAAGGSVSGPASPASVSAARFSGFSDSDIFNSRVSYEIRHKPRSGTIPGNLSMPSHGVIPITGAGAFRMFRYQAFSFRDSFSILA